MKKMLALMAILAMTLVCSCSKDNEVTGGYLVNQSEKVVFPTSDTPIEMVVTVTMTYDTKNGEYIFTADKVFPCDIKFKAFGKYGGVDFYTLKKGTTKVNHPFNKGDVNAPKDFYLINSLKHWKCNNDEKNEYVDGNITYRFYYSLTGQAATEDGTSDE